MSFEKEPHERIRVGSSNWGIAAKSETFAEHRQISSYTSQVGCTSVRR
jgi:hypothetical protein